MCLWAGDERIMAGTINSPLPSDRAEFTGRLLNAAHKKKHADNDAQLLKVRVAIVVFGASGAARCRHTVYNFPGAAP